MLATKRDLVAKKNYQYYLITNTRGDVIETRNGDGNVNAKFVYDAWGKLISVTNASGTPLASDSFAYQISLKYRGYVYDNETGLYYLQSRYYDPETGRFINADDVEYIGYSGEQLSYNAFAYCENNAINQDDKYGFSPGSDSLSKIFSKIFSVIFIFLLAYEIDTKYIYYTDSYSSGTVHIVDPQVEELVNSSKDNVYIVDYRTNEDPNMKVLSSYKITSKKHQGEIADIMLEYNSLYPVSPSWNRTRDSIVDEWRYHNLAYSMFYKRSNTADTDLNNNDEGKTFFDFIGR